MKLWPYIRNCMLRYPNQTVSEGNASMTYEELCVYAEVYAKKLTAPGYGIVCHSEMAAAMALLACLASEKTAVPAPTRYGEKTCLKIIDRAQVSHVLTDFSGELDIMETGRGEGPFKQGCRSYEPAVVLFTSGSTGTPKGVMISARNLLSNIKGISSYFPNGREDTILISRPLYHSSVLTGEFLVALCNGSRIVFSSEPFQPSNILRIIKREGVTAWGSTPTLVSTLSKFVRHPEEMNVKLLSVSGECMTTGMAQNIRKAFPYAKVFCGYGLSEASPRVAYLPPKWFDICPTAAGHPLPSVELRIVNDQGEDVTAHEIGELIVRGPNVMLGYFDDAQLTRSAIRDGWLHTGDLAYWGEDKLLHIKGRKDNMIIRAGMNIYPAEIENALSSDTRVESVLAYGYQSNDTQEVGITVSGSFSSNEEIMVLCRAVLPPYQIPSRIRLVDKPSILSGGKQNRRVI